MALNGDLLGTEIREAVRQTVENNREASEAQTQAIWRAIGNAIVNHIKANAQVVVTSVGGVTVGSGTSGPGSGTVV